MPSGQIVAKMDTQKPLNVPLYIEMWSPPWWTLCPFAVCWLPFFVGSRFVMVLVQELKNTLNAMLLEKLGKQGVLKGARNISGTLQMGTGISDTFQTSQGTGGM
jgi:hypothetical protein